MAVYRARQAACKRDVDFSRRLTSNFDYQKKLQESAASSPHVRTAIDTAPEHRLLVFPYLTDNLLQFDNKTLSLAQKNSIPKRVLLSLADLHNNCILHTDVKPNNIMVNCEAGPSRDVVVKDVQVTDLEGSVVIRPGKDLKGCVSANEIWRSPEPWRTILRRHVSCFGGFPGLRSF
ncbi:hypothetical protein B0T26DRAFT_675090 [Lasiosphaeria miniovina]|uniref:Protein kinase domain-containing protein n=1 Tax=Lasiosphaeria miniovina TaxID=1954250 RepID=A0AA40E0L5_9PEZI|nr:uncharacterized protein B0T26DRAFT_675090 [Lasiosphaeria miniovina]KAK0723529.1 hypothetical protein B0T26DRAFT_675090 [Lasiosphaeria miniovina]